MLTILSTLISFLMGGLPKLLDFFQDRNDKKHELALAAMQIERELELRKAGFEAQERVEQIHSAQLEMETTAKATENLFNAQVAEMEAIYKHDESLGEGTSQWIKDLRAGTRSFITMGFFLLLCFVDVGMFIYGYSNNTPFPALADKLWDSNTQALFASIVAFHFGGRAFGK